MLAKAGQNNNRVGFDLTGLKTNMQILVKSRKRNGASISTNQDQKRWIFRITASLGVCNLKWPLTRTYNTSTQHQLNKLVFKNSKIITVDVSRD